jgi:ABC-type arginine transport system permease subunit
MKDCFTTALLRILRLPADKIRFLQLLQIGLDDLSQLWLVALRAPAVVKAVSFKDLLGMRKGSS